jgi:hypothetical protein
MASETKIKIGVDYDDRPLKSLKSELREVVQQMYNFDAGSAEFEKLNQRAAEMRDKMAEVNEQIAVFATGSKYEQVGNSFGEISAGIQGLDFDRAVQGAKLFQQTAGKITFKDAIGSVKQLGSTFASVGKTILTNPLFLIVAVVGAIVAAIVALMDELGILKTIFEAVGKAIGWVVQQLKDFLDWLGITNYAAEDAAAKQAEAAEKIAEATRKKNEEVIQGYDNEIRMAKLTGKNTVEMERQKVKALQETAQARWKSDFMAVKSAELRGDLDEKELADLREKERLSKLAFRQSRDDVKFFEASIVAEKKKAQEKTAKDQEEANKKAGQKRKENKDKIKAEIDSIIEMNRKALRENELNAMESQDREIAIINDKFKEQIDKAKKFKQDYSSLEEQRLNEVNAINTKYADAELLKEEEARKSKLDAQKAFEEQLFALREDSTQKTIDAFTLAQQEETDALKEQLDKNLISIEQYNQGKKGIEEFYAAEIGKVRKEEADKEIARQELIKNTSLDLAGQVLSGIAANLKEGGAAAKAIAVAQATIDTYRAATAAFASTAANPISIGFPAAPFLAASAAVAMGIANVRKIIAVNPSTSGGGGSTPTASTGQIPSFGSAQPQQTPTMNLNNGQTQSASYQTKERVIVVDYNDISDKGKELEKSRQMVTLA